MGFTARLRLPNTVEVDSDPAFQRMLEESRVRQHDKLQGRERKVVWLTGLAFLFVAIPFAALVPSEQGFDLATAAVLVALYAVAMRVQFHTGSGWTDPTQLVFVPMLFLLPVAAVPLLVALAQLLFRLPEYLSRKVPLERAIVRVGDAWYAVGPAIVFALAGVGAPDLSDWPIYLAALGAQFGFDFANSIAREGLGFGVRLRDNLREVRWIYFVDAMLSSFGLLAAIASVQSHWTFLLLMPLIGLLAMFSREREARINNALTLSQAYRGTAHLLGEVLSGEDEYTGKHSRSVVVFAHQVGEEIGLEEKVLRDLELGALLHDVGKISVPNSLINKPGSLTESEWAVMRSHVTSGESMLREIGGVLGDVGQIVRSHHERWDGGGYPDGLRGDKIPIASRIIACCDAYHAMTSDRSYRMAMSREAAVEELQASSGSQFDPAVVKALIAVVEGWDDIHRTDDVEADAALALS